jgi:hypothetical protein
MFMTAAQSCCMRTVQSMKDEIAQTVVVQLLALPATMVDSRRGSTYKGLVTFAGVSSRSGGPARMLFVAPVPPRLTAADVASALLDELADQGAIAHDALVISVPIVDITPAYAEEILGSFRRETENMLRKKELEMLESMWKLEP